MNFSVIGGDLRLVKLAEMLSKDKNHVFVYGMEKVRGLDSIVSRCKSVEETIDKSDIVISSIPFSKSMNAVQRIDSSRRGTLCLCPCSE